MQAGKHQSSWYQHQSVNAWGSHMTPSWKGHSHRLDRDPGISISSRFRSHPSLYEQQLPPTILKMSLINEVHDSLPCTLPLSTNYHISPILIPTRHRRRALSHRAPKSSTAHQRRARPRTLFNPPPIHPRQLRIQILPFHPTRTRPQSHGCPPHRRHRPNPLRSPRTTNSEFRHRAP